MCADDLVAVDLGDVPTQWTELLERGTDALLDLRPVEAGGVSWGELERRAKSILYCCIWYSTVPVAS